MMKSEASDCRCHFLQCINIWWCDVLGLRNVPSKYSLCCMKQARQEPSSTAIRFNSALTRSIHNLDAPRIPTLMDIFQQLTANNPNSSTKMVHPLTQTSRTLSNAAIVPVAEQASRNRQQAVWSKSPSILNIFRVTDCFAYSLADSTLVLLLQPHLHYRWKIHRPKLLYSFHSSTQLHRQSLSVVHPDPTSQYTLPPNHKLLHRILQLGFQHFEISPVVLESMHANSSIFTSDMVNRQSNLRHVKCSIIKHLSSIRLDKKTTKALTNYK